MSKLTPLADRVVAKAVEAEEKTASGIYLPKDAQEKPQIAEVISIGDKVESSALKKGAQVLYKKYGSTEVKLDGEEYLVLNEEDILAVVE